MKNNKYQTTAFGGNNPIFIPFKTDEKEYDEIYVNDNIKQLEQKKLQEHNKKQQFNIDVDFMENVQETKLRSGKQAQGVGYGTYKKKYESDLLQNIVNCETDKELRKKKTLQERDALKAYKVISKYNENSNRVINSMKNE